MELKKEDSAIEILKILICLSNFMHQEFIFIKYSKIYIGLKGI